MTKIGNRYFAKQRHILFRWVFNLSPMYRRSTGRVIKVSPDFSEVVIKIPFSYKNRNYAGSIYGGSLFSATDPIYMVQLVQLLGHDFVIWDKESTVKFRRPAKEAVYAVFRFEDSEVEEIKQRVKAENEITITKKLTIINSEEQVFVELDKVLYIAKKSFYKEKLKKKTLAKS
ncbi:MAG: DUF4442 domain-containing protein [Bacteroidota bacterium]